MIPSPRPRTRRAAAVVEFAFVAPLLVLLVFGMIEFGRMVMVQQILTNAAREGGRKAVLPGATKADVESTIDSYMANSSLSGHTRTATPDPGTASAGNSVKVTVSVPYKNVSWLPVGTFGSLSTATLSATVEMRKEDY